MIMATSCGQKVVSGLAEVSSSPRVDRHQIRPEMRPNSEFRHDLGEAWETRLPPNVFPAPLQPPAGSGGYFCCWAFWGLFKSFGGFRQKGCEPENDQTSLSMRFRCLRDREMRSNPVFVECTRFSARLNRTLILWCIVLGC